MKKHSRIALHVALLAVMIVAVVAPVLLPDTSPVVLAYTGLRLSYDNVPQSLGWSVYDSNNVVDIENVFGECRCEPPSHIQNGWVIFDLGASFVVDYVTAASADSNLLVVQYSSNAITWSDPIEIWCINFCEKSAYFIAAGVGVTLRYLLFSTTNDDAKFNYFYVNILSDTPPTPTPHPTASPFPAQPTACVTVTPTPPATAQRTPTPFRLTPGATSTPGGTPTATPPPSFDSGLATFAQSLSPWTVSTPNYLGIFLTEWQATAGADGLPGLAYLRDYIGWLEPTPAVFTYTAPITGALTYSRPQGFWFPLRVTGQAKWASPTLQGETAYIRVWYFDPDYESVGHGAWVMAPPEWIQVDGSAWRSFATTVTQHGGSGRITAIAITEEIVDVVQVEHLGVQLDNLRIFSGPLAISMSYPICPGTGGSGKPPVAIKQCKVNALASNVYAGCTAPTDALDLAGWISYYFCRLWHYLWFVNENRAQITDILDRQNSNEPMGTLGEMDDVLGVLYETVSSVSAVYEGNDYYTIDWSSLFAGWNIDLSNITAGWDATPDPINRQEVLNNCPSVIANMNSDVQKSACFVIWLIKIKLRWWIFLQYILDASSIIFALSVILDWVGKHG